MTATATGLSGSPVEFDATGTNGGVLPGPIDRTKSTIVASPASFVAGSPGTTITVTARDANNNRIGGATVTLASTGTNFTFESTSLTTAATVPIWGRRRRRIPRPRRRESRSPRRSRQAVSR